MNDTDSCSLYFGYYDTTPKNSEDIQMKKIKFLDLFVQVVERIRKH